MKFWSLKNACSLADTIFTLKFDNHDKSSDILFLSINRWHHTNNPKKSSSRWLLSRRTHSKKKYCVKLNQRHRTIQFFIRGSPKVWILAVLSLDKHRLRNRIIYDLHFLAFILIRKFSFLLLLSFHKLYYYFLASLTYRSLLLFAIEGRNFISFFFPPFSTRIFLSRYSNDLWSLPFYFPRTITSSEDSIENALFTAFSLFSFVVCLSEKIFLINVFH